MRPELLGVCRRRRRSHFDEADLSPMARSFYDGSRRIANARIKSELGVKLRYPTYREGFCAAAASRRPC